MASVLAMLYIMLFSSLALGFYAAVGVSAQLARNDSRCASAQAAAESGLQFVRLQLARLDVPADTAPDKMLSVIREQLAAAMERTGNLGPRRVELSAAGVAIPGGASEFIDLDAAGQGFRAIITLADAGTAGAAGAIKVKVVGRSEPSGATRALEMVFNRAKNGSDIFDYGVAARGPVRVGSGTVVSGIPNDQASSVFTSTDVLPAVSVESNATLAGRIYMSEAAGVADLAHSARVGGSTVSAIRDTYVHAGVAAPAFPVVDTAEYRPYVLKANGTPNYYTKSMGKTLVNCVLKPGVYNFNNQMSIRGVLYIQTPSSVTFGGGVSIQGVIVVQNNPTGTPSENVLDFQGNGRFEGVEALPATAEFPPELRAKKGSLILAPGFAVNFGGNFGTVGGSVVASNVTFGGTATGAVRGTVIGLGNGPVSLTGKQVVIDHSDMVRNPPGLLFGYHFSPDPKTYVEVAP